MISIGLCVVAFLACVYMGRKSLVAGLCTLMAVGYAYGIVRANLPDGFSHLIFDAGTLGPLCRAARRGVSRVAAHAVRGRAQLADRADRVADGAVRHALAGSADSAGRPARQHLPAAVRAARLAAHRRRRLQAGAVVRRAERRRRRCWPPSSSPSASSRSSRATPSPISSIAARTSRTTPRYRIPSSFANAHSYAATMVLTIVIIAGAWVQGHHGKWQPRLMGAGLLASVLGDLHVGDAHQRADPLRADHDLDVHGQDQGGLSLPLAACCSLVVAYGVSGEERLQRFRIAAGSRVHRAAHRRQREPQLHRPGSRLSARQRPRRRRHERAVLPPEPDPQRRHDGERVRAHPAGAGHPRACACGRCSSAGSSRDGRSRRTTCSTSAAASPTSPAPVSFATGLIGTGLFTSVPSTAICCC